jgi:two-component system chemotaxis sensor kinase CheA
MNMAGELVLGRNQLLRALEDRADDVPGLVAILQHVDRVTTELQEGIMQTRMQPIGVLFNRYQRVVRDMARSLGKEINFVTEGAEVELDKSIIEMLADPLTHIIRNSVDHGLEGPEERGASGKSHAGRITITAFHEGGQVNIIISDDGRGIRVDKVLSKALEKGLIEQSEVSRLSHRDIVNLVMAPGFSTADKISDISGRGVGMDVVRTNIEKLGGNIELETSEGVGTTVMLRLPLTLAIIPSLIVGVKDARFAVPQVGIVELVLVRAEDVSKRIEVIGNAPTLRLRGKLLPLVRLADLLHIEERGARSEKGGAPRMDLPQIVVDRGEVMDDVADAEMNDREYRRRDYNILVLRSGGNQFGVIVDELFDIEEIVVKPLSSFLKETKCFAGTTILGDGRVIMILDTGGIADLADLKFTDLDRERAEKKLADEAAETTTKSIILFNNAEEEVFAVSQDKVLRLERIGKNDIERMGTQRFIKYRGAGLPVVRLDEHIPIAPLPEEAEELFLIIPKYDLTDGKPNSRARGGIIASKIIDAMDVQVSMQRPFFDGPGLEGAAIVGEKLTLFLDPVALLNDVGIVEGVVQ